VPASAPALTRVGIYANPTSGRGRAVALRADLGGRLTAAGHDVSFLDAPDVESARATTREAVHSGSVDVLAVVGGDGTVHLGTNACAGTDVPLLVVPGGTGNDNARVLGLHRGELDTLAGLVTRGQVRRVDVGRSRTPDGDRWWLGVLGGGFDTRVNDRGKRIRRLHGTARYLAAVAAELPSFRGIPYAVEVDGVRHETTAMLVAVGNGTSFGGGMQVCPDASMTDGLLDVMILHRVGRLEFLRIFPSVFSGGHVRHPAVQILRGRTVRLEAEGVRTTQADGEDFLPLPLELEVVPGALAVLAP